MKIRSFPQPPAGKWQARASEHTPPGDQFTANSQPGKTSPILRHALIGGAAVVTGTAVLTAAGHSLSSALHTIMPLAGLGAMGYLVFHSCRSALEPDVPLKPELDTLLQGRFSATDKQSVQKALNALGADNVRRLQEGGVKLLVDSDRVPAKAGACYYPGEHLACFRRGHVEKHYVIHELGHALDNLALPKELESSARYRSQADSLLQSNYQHYMEQVESPQPRRHTQWSEYAQTNHQEYLAEGVTYYLDSDQKKAELQRKDPRHFDYIEQFLSNP